MPSQSKSLMDADKTCALIEQHGIYGLCESDGCACCHFTIHNISVDVSCRKSEHCIRVYSNSLDSEAHGLERVMRAVLRSLAEYLGDANALLRYRMRFCEYGKDHVDGHWLGEKWIETHKCCWCGKLRDDGQAYLCRECLEKVDAVNYFPWTADGFMPSEGKSEGQK